MKEIELSTSLYWMISLTLRQCQINWFEGYRIKYFSLPNDIFDINKCQILKSKVPSRGHYMVSVTHTWAPSPQREREREREVQMLQKKILVKGYESDHQLTQTTFGTSQPLIVKHRDYTLKMEPPLQLLKTKKHI